MKSHHHIVNDVNLCQVPSHVTVDLLVAQIFDGAEDQDRLAGALVGGREGDSSRISLVQKLLWKFFSDNDGQSRGADGVLLLKPLRTLGTCGNCNAMSFPGEAELVADNVSKAVIVWFKQLTRLQSYRHSISAGNTHSAAVHYRIELWSAI